jgi:hypothetical protein
MQELIQRKRGKRLVLLITLSLALSPQGRGEDREGTLPHVKICAEQYWRRSGWRAF